MNRVRTLVCTPLVRVARFDHPTEQGHCDPAEETAPCHSVSFVEHGAFELRVGQRGWQLSPGTIFVTQPGLVYRCWHAERFPTDVCISVDYADGFFGAEPWGSQEGHWVVLPTNRLAYLRLRLVRHLTSSVDKLALENLAAELLEAVRREPEESARLYRESQLAWYAERIEAARSLLAKQFAETHSLAALGQAAGMSPFHFARVFRELTGTPPHRYLLQVRLTRAAERLRQGASVTETCYACGFNNLSHFIRLFRRTFGVPPSRFAHWEQAAAKNRKKAQAVFSAPADTDAILLSRRP